MTLTDLALRRLEEERERLRIPRTFGIRLSSTEATSELQFRHVAERRSQELALEVGGIVFFVPPDSVPRLDSHTIDVQQVSDRVRLVLLASDPTESEEVATSG